MARADLVALTANYDFMPGGSWGISPRIVRTFVADYEKAGLAAATKSIFDKIDADILALYGRKRG